MLWNITISEGEELHIKNIIKEDYIKKYDESNFDDDWKIYLGLPEFDAMGSIYHLNGELKSEFIWFSKSVHYIMRLVATYHINQALKALKYDTTNDENLASDGKTNIGSFWRIAKVWWGDKLDNSTLTEYGDGRFVPLPRIATFPITYKTLYIDEVSFTNEEVITTDKEEYTIRETTRGGHNIFLFVSTIWNEELYIEREVGQTKYDLLQKINQNKEIKLIRDQEIVVKTIHQEFLTSVCSHHFLPYFVWTNPESKIIIAYKPYDRLLGISKLTRVIQTIMNTPSLQEGITEKAYEALKEVCNTNDIFVGFYNLVHTCEATRWSTKSTSTTTEKAGWVFKDEILRWNIFRS